MAAEILTLEWRYTENWPYIGPYRLRMFTHDTAQAEDGTRFRRVGATQGEPSEWRIDSTRSVDQIITDVTEAPTDAEALAALNGVPRGLLVEVADQLHLDPYERASATVRREIVAEARA
jgi:hypothetical protein